MTRTTRTATIGTGRSSVIFDRVASGNVDPDLGASSRIDEWSLGPFGICDYDGPETIRLRKYATGTHLLLEEIGVETGVTSREVVWTKNKAKLFRYLRSDERLGEVVGRRRSVPVLLTYGFVLKPYVLDLVPGNSLVEYLVGEGFDVYMLDLGISDAEDADLSVEDLVLDYVHGAVQKVLEISGADEISLFGQSQGGTLCAMYTSLFPRGPLKNLVLLSAPTEFAPRNPGLLGLWTIASRSSGAYFDPAIVSKIFGNLPTDLASQIISSIASQQATVVGIAARPFGRGFDVYDAVLRSLRDLADRDVSVRSWLAVSKWVDDAAPFPGEIFRRWVRDFYQRDKLVKGEVKLPRWLLRLFDATAGDLAEWSEFDDAEECYTGILSLAKVGWDTNSEEARMGLSRYKVAPGVAVSDMDRARDFYEEKLGLSVRIDSGDNVQYRCGEGTMFHVYLSPEHAGNSTATLAGWGVDDIERVVDELASKGVVFERYDEGPIITNEKGIATFERDAKVAYFKDPDGNTLSIAQAPRS